MTCNLKRWKKEAKSVEEALRKRGDLVQMERNSSWDLNAWDAEAKHQRAGQDSSGIIMEQRANLIIRRIREYERAYVFGNVPSEEIPGPDTRDMGGQFLTNKRFMEDNSLLFQISKEVPKGCLLHLHFNAELDPKYLLALARTNDNMYIRSSGPICELKDLDKVEVVFSVIDPGKCESHVNIFTPGYVGRKHNHKPIEGWMKWKDFQEGFEEKFKKSTNNTRCAVKCEPQEPRGSGIDALYRDMDEIELNAAEAWVRSKMVLSPAEVYGHDQTVNG